MAKVKVDEIFGIPIFYDAAKELFTATVSGQDFMANRLSDLRRDINIDSPIEIDEPVIYAGSGEMVMTNIVLVDQSGNLTAGKRAGYGVSPCPKESEVFPITSGNIKIYNAHKSKREKGWELIRQADAMYKQLERYPKGYWYKLAKGKALDRQKGL